MRLQVTDPQKFATASLLIIAAAMIATSIAESSFYRQAIVKHEAALFSGMVEAIANRDEVQDALSSWDLEHYGEKTAQGRLAHTFGLLSRLPGFVRIKIFRADQTIVWSDAPQLIGTNLTHHRDELIRAIKGSVRVVFNAERGAKRAETLPRNPLLELYIPFTLPDSDNPSHKVRGVLSIYRSPAEINATIQRGLYLLWAVTGISGLVLYAALYRLFYAVYFSRQTLRMQLSELGSEHGRLMQIEKLSALGQMSGEIAHQLNNPLVGVINLAQLAEREPGNSDRIIELLSEIRKAGEHCRDVVQRMLRINKMTKPEPQLIDLSVLVDETIQALQRGSADGPSINVQKPAEPIMIQVDPLLIRNALYNLIHNAAQANPGGTVTVTLASSKEGGNQGYQIAVADSGPGIGMESPERLFNPLYTTRPGGTGLGLSIAQHVVALHRGTIRAENRRGGGAVFTIWLPEKSGDNGKDIAR